MKQLLDYIDKPNIAEELSEDVLIDIGRRVRENFDRDYESMTDWRKSVDEGIKLMQQEWEPKSYPWPNASNYKDPILTEASVKFGDKASLELLRVSDLVSADVIGRDPEGQKKALCERVSEAMNYQVNYDMSDWRESQSRLFYTLPNVGTAFKKLVYDENDESCESVIIQYPDFVVNQAAPSMEKARSFSHILDIDRNGMLERINAGKWIDHDLYDLSPGSVSEGSKGSNEDAGVTESMDNPDFFVEQQCFFDLDDDGYEEPYTITVHYASRKVFRVEARFDRDTIFVKNSEGKIASLTEMQERFEQMLAQEYGGDEGVRLIGLPLPVFKESDYDLVKIEPFQNIVKYGFIPSPDGTFLDHGYYHLLGALTQAVNTNTNQLTDSGTLSNLGGGWLSREFRRKSGVTRLKPGEFVKTDIPADKLRNAVLPKPVQEPSSTLYGLRNDALERAMSFMAVVDVSGKLQANTAPTTALAIIQEAIIPTTALFQRIIRAESKEFQILFKIDQRTFPADKYQMILDEPGADPQADFNSKMMDIVPTANAEMSSKMQRIQTATIEMEMFDRVLQAGGNPIPIARNFFEAIGSQITEQVFPEEGAMSPQEKQQLEQMQKALNLQNQLQEMQLSILSREQDRLDAETKAGIQKTMAEITEIMAGLQEIQSKVVKNLEEAESEAVKNQIDTYTAMFGAMTDRMKAMGDIQVRSQDIQSRAIATQ